MQPVSGVLSQSLNFEGLLDRDNKARVIDVMVDKFAAAPDVEALYTKGGPHRWGLTHYSTKKLFLILFLFWLIPVPAR